jgi:hypothetical protein
LTDGDKSWYRFRQRIAACFTQRTAVQCHLIVLCLLSSDRAEDGFLQALHLLKETNGVKTSDPEL